MSELEAAAADLESRLADANDQAQKQKSAFERMGRESLTLKDALAQMKQRSAEMAVKAQARGGPSVWARPHQDETSLSAERAAEGAAPCTQH